MKNRWNKIEAKRFADNPQSLRVYTSRLLGQESQLVLHGGGNTSVKMNTSDFFGNDVETLFVKGSGWDLATIEGAGFAPERLDVLKALAAFGTLSDSDMVEQQRIALLDSKAPNASVEAILHAMIPFRDVDHTHADAVLAVTNTANGKERIDELYGDRVIVIPYVMPGFALAKLVYELTQGIDWNAYEGMILMNHGVFTFSDDARASYEKMIELVSEAEDYLESRNANQLASGASQMDPIALAEIRKQVSKLRGAPVIANWDQSPEAVGYSNLPSIESIGTRGPLTPDHSIFAKRIPAVLGPNPQESIETYASEYEAYFKRNADDSLACLDTAPRWAIWPKRGILSFGLNAKNASVISDIASHTAKVVQLSENLGGWTPLSESDVFDVEYWELEQAKLKSNKTTPALQGRIAVVTSAASEVGRVCVEDLLKKDAAVIALDENPIVATLFESPAYLGIACEDEDADTLGSAIKCGVEKFGGLDILVTNLSRDASEESTPNSDAILKAAFPFLLLGINPSIVIIGSRATASSKRQTQIARDNALETAGEQVRVNLVIPDSEYGAENPEMPQLENNSPNIESYAQTSGDHSRLSGNEIAHTVSSLAVGLF